MLSFTQVSQENREILKKISDYVWNVEEADIVPQNRVHFKSFQKQRIILQENNMQDSLLIPLGLSYDEVPSVSIFNTNKLLEAINEDSNEIALVIYFDGNWRFLQCLADQRFRHSS